MMADAGSSPATTSFWLQAEAELLLVVVAGLLLVGIVIVASRAVELLPMKPARRRLWQRLHPLFSLLLAFAYLSFATRALLRRSPSGQELALATVLVSFAAAGWFAFRNVVAGVLLRASGRFQVGDQINLGELEGRVESLDLGTLTLQTSRGHQAVVPYVELSQKTLLRTPVVPGSALYVFQLCAPQHLSTSEVRRAVFEYALTCHWASVVRAPVVKPAGQGLYEVTVYALSADYGPEIEAHIRKAPQLQPAPGSATA